MSRNVAINFESQKFMRQNNCYVYELAYPESMGGKVFYVGKGQKGHGRDRIDLHEAEARKGIQSPKCDVIREIWANGEQVVKRKIYTGLSHEMALQLEDETVVKHGFKNLTNLSRTGEKKWVTPEYRARRSREAKAKWDEIKGRTVS